MKLAGILAGVLILSVSGARAQAVQASPYFLLPPAPNFLAMASPAPAALALSAASAPRPAPAPAPMPQMPQGVYPEQYWQAFGGFTYFRFYEVPGTRVNNTGLEASMAYYVKDWLAAEGEIDGGANSTAGKSGTFFFGGGGLRARYKPSRAYDLWIHALAGGAHLSPQLSYGGPDAFAYEMGAGLDLNFSRHLGYRAEADIIGSMFFGTYQLSPRISGGVVYNF